MNWFMRFILASLAIKNTLGFTPFGNKVTNETSADYSYSDLEYAMNYGDLVDLAEYELPTINLN